METVGYAALQIIPTTKGLASSLSSQVVAPMGSVGAKAGVAAGAGYKKSFLGGVAGIAGPIAGLIGISAGVSFFGDVIAEGREAGQVSRQTVALLKSTGGAANLSAGQIATLANSLSDYAAIDDEIIQQGANVLLTFRNIQDQAGKGNAVFDRAAKAALDLSGVLGTDMRSSALQLGKALNDPVKGVTALGRAGVQFTQDQKDQIKTLVESNDLLGAQRIILGEVEHQVGGAAGANKDALDELGVSFKNLEEDLSKLVLPAMQGFATIATNDLIPAISATGGFVGDAATAFGDLPDPIRDTAVAVGILAVAQRGLNTSFGQAQIGRASSAMDTLRLRTMLAGDAYRTARQYSVDFSQSVPQINSSLSRTKSLMAATSAATTGLGTSMKRGLGGIVGALGGPWGLAIVGGITALSLFAQKNAEAAQDVEDLKATLNAQTGAITKNSIQWAASKLADKGLIDDISKLGLNANLVTRAMLGNKDAAATLNTELDALNKQYGANSTAEARSSASKREVSGSIGVLRDAVSDANGVYDEAREKALFVAAAQEKLGGTLDDNKGTAEKFTVSMKQLKDELFGDQKAADAARRAHDRLADALSESIRGNISYRQSVHDAFEEAKNGVRTLDVNTEAGRKNKSALLDVSDAWNALGDKAKAIPGRYRDAREEFEKVARAMGATKKQADKLADKLLDLPKRTIEVPIKLHIVGTDKGRHGGIALPGYANGGYVGGSGIGDKQLILADSREYIVKPSAAAYWGPEFLKAINNKRMPPHMAQGGPVSPSPSRSSSGVNINVGEVRAHNYQDFMTQMQRRARASASSELPMPGMG